MLQILKMIEDATSPICGREGLDDFKKNKEFVSVTFVIRPIDKNGNAFWLSTKETNIQIIIALPYSGRATWHKTVGIFWLIRNVAQHWFPIPFFPPQYFDILAKMKLYDSD